jgi:hypothetical protein
MPRPHSFANLPLHSATGGVGSSKAKSIIYTGVCPPHSYERATKNTLPDGKIMVCWVSYPSLHYLTSLPGQIFHQCTRCSKVVCDSCKLTYQRLAVFIILPFSMLDLPFISAILAPFIACIEPSLAFLIIYLEPLLQTYRLCKLPSRVIKIYSLLEKKYITLL